MPAMTAQGQQSSFGKQVKESQSEVVKKQARRIEIEEDKVPFFITDKKEAQRREQECKENVQLLQDVEMVIDEGERVTPYSCSALKQENISLSMPLAPLISSK